MLYDDSLVQGLEGIANVESNINSILSYSQYWMRHTTLEIKFELKMESHHMVGTNIKQEYAEIGRVVSNSRIYIISIRFYP